MLLQTRAEGGCCQLRHCPLSSLYLGISLGVGEGSPKEEEGGRKKKLATEPSAKLPSPPPFDNATKPVLLGEKTRFGSEQSAEEENLKCFFPLVTGLKHFFF